jgi:hypothetical protein
MKGMTESLIDVWNVETFDQYLLAELRANAELIRNYIVTERNNFLEREASDRRGPYPTNPYAASYLRFLEDVGRDMEARTIRAWHYTRLTDAETDTLRNTGIYASTLETIRRRLDAQVAAGVFSAEIADALFAQSPFHHDEQSGPRSNKFWMTSHPVGIEHSGVTLLLGNWGGEAVYFWLKDAMLEELVAGIGKPRVIEMAVPLDATRHAYSASRAIVATFGRTLGCVPDDTGGFDLYATRSLGPQAVLAIHTEGEAVFAEIAKGYPAEFFGRERR